MATSSFYTKEKAEKELAEKEIANEEQAKRKLFFDRCKKDPLFQKYIVQEILIANINSLNSTETLMDVKRTKEELADLIIANIKASKTLTNMLAAIIN